MKIKGIEFDVEYDFDRDGRLENMAVFLPMCDEELSEVLSEEVLKLIEEKLYSQYEGANINEDDPREDR